MIMRFSVFRLILLSVTISILVACAKQTPEVPETPFAPTPLVLDIPQGFPTMQIPAENPLTLEGVELGRKLFHEPMLSGNNTMSCATCHLPSLSFTDGERFSIGIEGLEGKRNAMSLINAGWLRNLNWDGSKETLERQGFEPITNPLEMNEKWSNVIEKLKADQAYTELFYAAFGTQNFDSTLVVKAIAQFERTFISSNSKWDRYLRGEYQLTLSESIGFEIFFTERGDCFHCHSTILFTDHEFHNNGLDEVFTDQGLFEVTGDPNDRGRFRTPTLRNAVFTAPYMHDGRFETLEEVIDFYSEGLRYSPTIDPLMKNVDQGGVRLTEEEKFHLLSYLKTLTDTTFILNPAYAAP